MRNGDREAFSVLVRRYYDRCIRYAVRMLSERSDAEDVVQETFLRAFRALDEYREQGHFKAWLFRILLNQCRTRGAGRTRQSERTVSTRVLRSRRHALDSGESDLLRRQVLRDALDDLRPLLREAFLLKYVEEMTYEEMSESTGDGISALKMRVKRACDTLRDRLEGRIA